MEFTLDFKEFERRAKFEDVIFLNQNGEEEQHTINPMMVALHECHAKPEAMYDTAQDQYFVELSEIYANLFTETLNKEGLTAKPLEPTQSRIIFGHVCVWAEDLKKK